MPAAIRMLHLPTALEHHVDPPDLGTELAQLRTNIRKAGQQKMTIEGVTMTPKLARACLHLRQKRNRKVLPSKVALISTMLLEGRFRSVELMRFDWDGDFRDGQHRAEAIARSGKTINVDLQFGIDPDDFQFIDAGQRRTADQFLDLDGVKQAKVITAIVRLMARVEHQGAVYDDHRVFLEGKAVADALMAEAIGAAWRLRQSQKVILSSAALAYRNIASGSRHARRLGDFWDRLVLGDMLTTTDPIYQLRTQFRRTAETKARKGHQYLTQTQHAAWIVIAWNAWVRNDTLASLKAFRWEDPNSLPAVK